MSIVWSAYRSATERRIRTKSDALLAFVIVSFIVACPEGIEPSLRDLEFLVLPLHQGNLILEAGEGFELSVPVLGEL